jgi:hypothetical protein
MIHFTIFGGTEADLTSNLRVCLTLFGATEIRRPTLAKQVLQAKRRSRNEQHGGKFAFRNRCLVVTIFGGTTVQCPTLAEEFADLRALLTSEAITTQEWDRAVSRLGDEEGGVEFVTLTLFGGFGVEYPSKSAEIEQLEKHAELGLISQREQSAMLQMVEYDPKDARSLLAQVAGGKA